MNSNTNWNVIIAGAAVTIVTVTMLLLKLSVESIGIIDSLILGVLAHSGLLQAADETAVTTLANSVAPQIVSAVQVVKDDLTQLHTISTANVAALHTAVAVQAVTAGAPLPPPLIPPVVPAPATPAPGAVKL
jgi:hypothetical protein